jgi:CRP-like cAMP-binding protein
VPERRLSNRQIINNLQYALADMAGKAQSLEERVGLLAARNTELAGAARLAPKSNEKKLTDSDVRRIRTEHKTGRFSQSEIASWYDLNRATVSRIVRNKYHARIR